MNLSYQAITLFFSLSVSALPWLVLGVIVSSGLLVFVPKQKLANLFPRHRILGVIIGSSLGLLLPVSQYGNIPVARRLLLQGVPLSIVFSFLVAAPTINPIVIWLSFQALPNVNLILSRIAATWLMAIAVGFIFSFHREPSIVFNETESLSYARSSLLKTGTFIAGGKDVRRKSALRLFVDNFIREMIELGTWLTFGCAIAATVQTFLPQIQMLRWGQTASTQILLMILLGFILSLGSPYSNFFLSPLASMFVPGALLSFLLFSSAIDLKSIEILFSVFRPKIILYLILLLFLLTVFFSLVFNFYIA